MSASISIIVPGALNTLGTAVSMAGFAGNGLLTAQLPATAGENDGADFYAGNISNATSTAQLTKLVQATIPGGGESGQQPTYKWSNDYLFVYAVRTAIDTAGALTATIVGPAEPSGGSGSPNAILQGGNSFGAEIDIGPRDGQAFVIGAGGAFADSNCTAITLDTTTTGPINIGTNANAKTVTIGNSTGATSVVINAGTGAINIGTSAAARSINIGTGAAAQTVTLGSTSGASAVTVDAGTGSILIGTSASARRVDLGTGLAAQTVTVGSISGASSTTINAGTGNIDIGTTAQARAINIGTAAAAQTVTIGSSTGASSVTLDAGTGSINIGATAVARSIAIATGAAAMAVTVGNSTGGTSLTLDAGTGTIAVGTSAVARTINIGTGAAIQTIGIGTGAVANVITIGSTTGAASLALRAGTGLITLTGGTLWGGTVALGNFAGGGSIGSAATTVDIATSITVAQTTGGQILTLPNPTTTTQSRMVIILNVGSASFTMLGKTVAAAAANANQALFAFWDATASRWTTTA